MKGSLFKFTALFFLIMFVSSIITPINAQTKNKINNISELKGDKNVLLRVSVDYFITKKKVLTPNKFVEYTVTNIGTEAYDGTISDKNNAIVFDLTTKDGIVIEKSVSFKEKLSPGKSTMIKYLVADVGPKRVCVDVKASRLDYISSN